jgi:hypothetical protein
LFIIWNVLLKDLSNFCKNFTFSHCSKRNILNFCRS